MRTKTLLCAAVLAAGVATSMAQSNVYSLNVVGYYNIAYPGTNPVNTLVLISDQLVATNGQNNMLQSVLPYPMVPVNSQFYSYNLGFAEAHMDVDDLVWEDSPPDPNTITFNPGQAALFRSPTACTLTFVGEVMQGSLTNGILPGQLALRSSMVPQAGRITTDLGFPAEPNDQVYLYDKGWSESHFDVDDLQWEDLPGNAEPSVAVGTGLLIRKVAGGTNKWIRNFTVQ